MTTGSGAKPRILLVDDDAFIVRLYRKQLSDAGYEVEVAEDGLAAMKGLKSHRPNLAVLDIMMPKFSGLEVLNFIRSNGDLANTKVVVLSNFYFDGDERKTVLAKADAEFVKSNCTPTKLLDTIKHLLSEGSKPVDKNAAPTSCPSQAGAREDFLKNAASTMVSLRQLNTAFLRARGTPSQNARLLDFYRRTHFVTSLAGLAGFPHIALLSNAFEALLMELHEKPETIGPSTLQTVAMTLDYLGSLITNAEVDTPAPATGHALVVDDEPLATRAMTIALQRAKLKVTSFPDAQSALNALEGETFDLMLFDIFMPDMDGVELCKRVRALPQYKTTPVIFVTAATDFQKRAETVMSGGNDLIAKPFRPIELAVKAVMLLLRAKLPARRVA
jgi:DNA-binding response OmpR family regulator